MQLPPAAEPRIDRLSIAFTRPTFKRFVLLMAASILTPGRRTVAQRAVDGAVVHGRAREQRSPRVERATRVAVAVGPGAGGGGAGRSVRRRAGGRGDGRPRHLAQRREGLRQGQTPRRGAFEPQPHGLAVRPQMGGPGDLREAAVRLPAHLRGWVLPVVCELYRTAEQDRAEGRRHKTPIQLARGLMASLCRWFPRRTFVFLGDGGFSSHQTASFGRRHARRATMVGKPSPDANLYDPPPPRRPGQPGRPRVKGDKRPTPREAAETGEPTTTTVAWYGGSDRRVALVSDMGHWCKSGRGLVPVRWVYVRDKDGTLISGGVTSASSAPTRA